MKPSNSTQVLFTCCVTMDVCVMESCAAVLSNLSVLPRVFNSHQFGTHQTMQRLPWCLQQTQMLLWCFFSHFFFPFVVSLFWFACAFAFVGEEAEGLGWTPERGASRRRPGGAGESPRTLAPHAAQFHLRPSERTRNTVFSRTLTSLMCLFKRLKSCSLIMQHVAQQVRAPRPITLPSRDEESS